MSTSPNAARGNAVAGAIEQLADAFVGEDFVDGAPSLKPQLPIRPRP